MADLKRLSRPAVFRHFTLRAFVPVAATYVLAALGMHLGQVARPDLKDGPLSPAAGVGLVLLFTATHGVLPVFFYRAFASASRGLWPLGCFFYGHMGFWFGVPIVGLAAMTGWLSLLGPAVHLAMARRGTRTWTYMEYGSTSLALLLFIVVLSGQSLFPWGVVVALAQSLLLGVVGTLGRGLWIKDDAHNAAPRTRRAPVAVHPADRRRATLIGCVLALFLVVFFGTFGSVTSYQHGERLFLYFFGTAGLVMGVAVGSMAYLGVVGICRRARVWREFAEREGGSLASSAPMLWGLIPSVPISVGISFGGTTMTVKVETARRGGRDSPHLALTFARRSGQSSRVEVRTRGVASQLKAVLGGQDFEAERRQFDEHFAVRAADDAAASKLLTFEVQELLLRMKLWLRDRDRSEQLELTADGFELCIRLQEMLDDPEELTTFFGFGRELQTLIGDVPGKDLVREP